MATKLPKSAADYIVPLDINGLEGRMLHMPPPKGKNVEFLFIYGHHSSLERWFGLMQAINKYAAVTMPDIPGFGGMDSFYKIGKKPTIDNLADYLAAFMKLRYKRKKVVVAGMSFGFVVATRMLQRYPELSKNVTLLVSIAGFAHKDDFMFSRRRVGFYVWGARIMRWRPLAVFFRYVILHPRVLHMAYGRTRNARSRFESLESQAEFDAMMEIETGLWHDNDLRTWMYTTDEFFHLDNCQKRIDLPVWLVTVKNDHYFNNHLVEQHMRVIFKDVHREEINMPHHSPSVIADAKMAAPFIPPKLRRKLASL